MRPVTLHEMEQLNEQTRQHVLAKSDVERATEALGREASAEEAEFLSEMGML